MRAAYGRAANGPVEQCGRVARVNGTVVLLPPMSTSANPTPRWPARAEIAAELAAYSVPIYLPSVPKLIDAATDERSAVTHWVAHIAVEITSVLPQPPLLLVATGAAGSHLPALGFSQRASRHPVMGYVLVDADFPRVAGRTVDWPDAPVDVVTTPAAGPAALAAARLAELRGWTVHPNRDPAAVLRALVGR